MKKQIVSGLLFLAIQCVNAQINSKLQPYVKNISYNKLKQPSFISLKESPPVKEAEVPEFINNVILQGGASRAAVLKSEKDAYGFTTTKYSLVQNGITIYNKVIVAHCKNGRLVSVNGDMIGYSKPENQASLSEKDALAYALKKVNAQKYKWENKEEEESMRKEFNNPNFSYYPTGTQVLFDQSGKLRMAYQFNIYAEKPLYRAYVFVDASTGQVLGEQNLICNSNVTGTASTLYSGPRTITSDQTGPGTYVLQETTRGQGIRTYNVHNSLSYANPSDFTNNSANWSVTNFDQAAEDAHWGAESTYDFYFNKFNINSIDNAGLALVSYMHYDTQFDNAFWNGQFMTYGDGDGSFFGIFTALDICGHEITHGLVSNTAMLGSPGYDQECDALNEGFADIFGTSIEHYARPTNWNWLIGSDICLVPGQALRNMSNPNAFQQPDTYMGTHWDPNGEPHNNNGPCIFWFYLLVSGGSGTNDNGNTYNVSGLGNTDAEKIAYRALTTYFTPNTTYADARVAAMQAATDLFGDCSNQLQQTANAWYAVGVGTPYSVNIAPDFIKNDASFCTLPASFNFSNTTISGQAYIWNFGDGSGDVSTTDASHTYQTDGIYTVKLKATGCGNAQDSIIKTVVVNIPDVPIVTSGAVCTAGQATLAATGNNILSWYLDPTATNLLGTGSNFVTPSISVTTTFYVVNSTTNAPVTGGLLSYANGGFQSNFLDALIFDVLQTSQLNSVHVYAQQAGIRIVELRDAFGFILDSVSVPLTQGSNTVQLNFPLTPGTGYQLGLDNANSSLSNLFRSNSHVNYPYSIGSCVNITGSTSGNTEYFWYYNWNVTPQGCSTAPVAVTGSVAVCTGINSLALSENDLSVYPNPFTDQVMVRSNVSGPAAVTISDVTGRLITERTIATGEENISLPALPKGLYLMSIRNQSNKVIKTVKLVKE